MDQLREEFKELLKRSGWNQSEAARNLDLPAPSISRYVNDIDTPSRQTIRLFKMMLMDAPEASDNRLPSKQSENDLAAWKRRATTAEKKLADMQSGLRAVLAASSKPLSDAQVLVKRAAGED
jgi:plasmid maintenance system antidote protein VapI